MIFRNYLMFSRWLQRSRPTVTRHTTEVTGQIRLTSKTTRTKCNGIRENGATLTRIPHKLHPGYLLVRLSVLVFGMSIASNANAEDYYWTAPSAAGYAGIRYSNPFAACGFLQYWSESINDGSGQFKYVYQGGQVGFNVRTYLTVFHYACGDLWKYDQVPPINLPFD